jgi:hypothetical protein
MRKYYLLAIALFLGMGQTFAQTELANKKVPINISKSELKEGVPLPNQLEVQTLKNGVTAIVSGGKPVELNDLTPKEIVNALTDLGLDLDELSPLDLNNLVSDIFNAASTSKAKTVTSAPVSLRLKVTSAILYSTVLYVDDKGDTTYNNSANSWQLETASMRIEGGTIKDLVVEAKSGNKTDYFVNTNPIPIMTLNNLTKYLGEGVLVKQGMSPNQKEFLFLNRVLKVAPELQLKSGNLSPKDQLVTIDKEHIGWAIPVKKEGKDKLFDARLYSDLLGLNSDVGNGLIQVEVRKKIFIHANHFYPKNNFQTAPGKITLPSGWWYFSRSIEPIVSWNKLESADRVFQLDPSHIVSRSDGDYSITTNLNLLNYASFQAGIEWNVLEYALTSGEIALLGVFNFRQTPFTNDIETTGLSDVKISKVNSISPGAYIRGTIRPESIYEGELMVGVEYLKAATTEFRVVPEIDEINLNNINMAFQETRASLMLRASFTNRIELSKNSTFFVRGRFNFDLQAPGQNFYEVQLGTSFNILGKEKK